MADARADSADSSPWKMMNRMTRKPVVVTIAIVTRYTTYVGTPSASGNTATAAAVQPYCVPAITR